MKILFFILKKTLYNHYIQTVLAEVAMIDKVRSIFKYFWSSFDQLMRISFCFVYGDLNKFIMCCDHFE